VRWDISSSGLPCPSELVLQCAIADQASISSDVYAALNLEVRWDNSNPNLGRRVQPFLQAEIIDAGTIVCVLTTSSQLSRGLNTTLIRSLDVPTVHSASLAANLGLVLCL
jgi:hypothetical protein